MTFSIESFRASRREVADLGKETGAEHYDAKGDCCTKAGYMYAGGLHIERDADGMLTLVLYRDSWTVDASELDALESKLYAWGVEERVFEGLYDEWAEERLIEEHEAYCTAQQLPQESADDLLACHPLTAEQRATLEAFVERWEQVQR